MPAGSFDVRGKVALVTGGARGIGFETAQELHRRGASVVILDLDGTAAELAAAALGARALGLGVDVTDLAALDAAVAEAVRCFGGLDVVVANAGIAPRVQTVRTTDPAVFDRVIEVNLLGVHRTVHAALPQIVERGGHVVVIASVYAFMNGVLVASYAAAKAGVEQFGRALRPELAQRGASAGVAYFGAIDTAMLHEGLADDIGGRAERALPALLVRRIGPEAAARAIVRGIERRAPRTIAPRRWVPVSLMRGLANPLLDRWLERNARMQAVVRDADRTEVPVRSGRSDLGAHV